MQTSKNKYQRDKRGYIIDNTKENESNNDKGKAKVEAVSTKNKFNALEVEEIAPPMLRITDGKGNNINTTKRGNPYPNDSRIRDEDHGKENQEVTLSPKSTGSGIEMAARRVKKEAVEAANKENNVKPSQTGIQSPGVKEERNEVNSRKTLWSDEADEMEAQIGSTNATGDMEDKGKNQTQKIGSLALTTVNPRDSKTRVDDQSSPKIKEAVSPAGDDRRTSKEAGNHEGSSTAPLAKNYTNGTVNPRNSREIWAAVDGVPVYDLRRDRVGDVNME
ncbi:hypothetical protein A4A49_34955, partial [Nicotiana attenuata]